MPHWGRPIRLYGLKYEIAVHWLTGKIHWVAGPVFGAVHDLTLARLSGILQRLRPNEFLLADKGYIGEAQILCPFKGRSEDLTWEQWVWNHSLNPVRVIVENALARICKFSILTTFFRGGINTHRMIFNICAQLARVDIASRPLRRDYFEAAPQGEVDADLPPLAGADLAVLRDLLRVEGLL